MMECRAIPPGGIFLMQPEFIENLLVKVTNSCILDQYLESGNQMITYVE